MNDSNLQLERYYAENGPAILAYLRRRSSSRTAAEDLLQETFLRAWRQREQWSQIGSVRAYLFGIARHVWLDARRRQRLLEPLPDEIPSEPETTRDERIEIMRVAIGALPVEQRETLQLKLQHELSYAEIADVLHVPVGTVRSRLHHAVRRLEAILNPLAPTKRPSTSTPSTHES